jgi:hypothetical protein
MDKRDFVFGRTDQIDIGRIALKQCLIVLQGIVVAIPVRGFLRPLDKFRWAQALGYVQLAGSARGKKQRRRTGKQGRVQSVHIAVHIDSITQKLIF